MVPKLMLLVRRDPIFDGEGGDAIRFMSAPADAVMAGDVEPELEVFVRVDQWERMGKPDRIRVTVEA